MQTQTTIPVSISEPLSEPTEPVRLGFQLLLAAANAGATCTLLPVLNVLIPAQATEIDPANQASNLGLVLALGAFGALVGNPLAGALSDRTTSRLGRRRPWLLVGMIGSAAALLLLANSYSIVVLAAAWTMAQFFGNMLLSGYGSVMPDRVPVRQRGATQAILGLASPVAFILSNLLFTGVRDLRAAYFPLIAAQVFFTLLFVALYREPRLPKESQPAFSLRRFLDAFVLNPRKHPKFALVWLMWFLVWLGYTLGAGSFLFLYLQHVVQYESLFPGHQVKDGMALLQILQIVVGVPLMFGAGILSDRAQNRQKFVLAGTVLIAAGVVGLIMFHTWVPVVIASVTIGAGFWIFYSLGLAMITQLLPSASDRGKDLGVINIASTLPQIIMPPVGAAILNAAGISSITGYTVIFAIGGAALLLAIVLLREIKG